MKIGFIGLGQMGSGIAANLIKGPGYGAFTQAPLKQSLLYAHARPIAG